MITVAAYRVHPWLDTSKLSSGCDELPIKFGVQGRVKGERKWRHMAEAGKAVIFDTADEAQAYLAQQTVGEVNALAVDVRPAAS